MPAYNGSVENIIVVMLENRSYDNVLGWLYNSDNQKPYKVAPKRQNGLNGLNGHETNPDPNHKGQTIKVANQTTSTQNGSGFSFPPTVIPAIDPGEPFDDMAQQILGTASKPSSNPYVKWPQNPPSSTLMQGFTLNYVDKVQKSFSSLPDIMNYFKPPQVPVTSFLANNFAVCDCWFASVPTQTYTNRAFGHCAAPAVTSGDKNFSLVDDLQYFTDKILELPSVLSALDAVLTPVTKNHVTIPNWKIYFHDYCISKETVPYVKTQFESDTNINVSTYDNSDWGTETPTGMKTAPSTFFEDIANGNLPPYSFIEPRYFDSYSKQKPHPAANSNHPGKSNYPGSLLPPFEDPVDNPIDVSSGELFLMNLYNTLRNSDYWEKCMLIITYDEHGGVYDHVAPPAATPPGTINWGSTPNPPIKTVPSASNISDPASDGFEFNVLGGRVPTIVVSPYVKAGSQIVPHKHTMTSFDHSSIVRTVSDLLNPIPDYSLTERDAVAPSLKHILEDTVVNNTVAFSGVILAAPSFLTFKYILFDEKQKAVVVANAGGFPLTVTVTSGSSWLTQTTTGTDALEIVVEVDMSGLSKGTYNGTIEISSSDTTVDTITLPVTAIK